MEADISRGEVAVVIIISALIFAGFYILYISGLSLDYLITINANMPEKMVVSQEGFSLLGFLTSNFTPIIIAAGALAVFALSISVLSVRPLGNIKYILLLPIFMSGVLFNFSILFLFFGFGLFIAHIYAIPLGQTYFMEFKKWKLFRVGSNAAGKALFVLFLFVLAGSYIALSSNLNYRVEFSQGFKSSMVSLVGSEMENMKMQQSLSGQTEQFVQSAMSQARHENPGLTEKQYKEMEQSIRANMTSTIQNSGPTESEVKSLVESSIDSSPLANSLIVWFPLIFSITIWGSLELLRMLILSPLAGVFSYILFHIPFFADHMMEEAIETKVRAIGYKP